MSWTKIITLNFTILIKPSIYWPERSAQPRLSLWFLPESLNWGQKSPLSFRRVCRGTWRGFQPKHESHDSLFAFQHGCRVFFVPRGVMSPQWGFNVPFKSGKQTFHRLWISGEFFHTLPQPLVWILKFYLNQYYWLKWRWVAKLKVYASLCWFQFQLHHHARCLVKLLEVNL